MLLVAWREHPKILVTHHLAGFLQRAKHQPKIEHAVMRCPVPLRALQGGVKKHLCPAQRFVLSLPCYNLLFRPKTSSFSWK